MLHVSGTILKTCTCHLMQSLKLSHEKWGVLPLYCIWKWRHRCEAACRGSQSHQHGPGTCSWVCLIGKPRWTLGICTNWMAIVFQHPVGLNASFGDGRLHRLLFSFRFYAWVKSLCYDLLQQHWFSNFKTTMQLEIKWKENTETFETFGLDPY